MVRDLLFTVDMETVVAISFLTGVLVRGDEVRLRKALYNMERYHFIPINDAYYRDVETKYRCRIPTTFRQRVAVAARDSVIDTAPRHIASVMDDLRAMDARNQADPSIPANEDPFAEPTIEFPEKPPSLVDFFFFRR